MLFILVILLVLLVVGVPQWGWHDYGYYPAGLVSVLIVVLVVLLLMGRL